MLYEVINQDGKVMAGTTYKSCIYPMDLMIRMNENGWRFRIDGKLVPKTNFKSSMEQAIANAVCEHGTEYNPDGDEPSEKKSTPTVNSEPVKRTRRGGKVRCIDTGEIYNSQSEAAKDLKIDPAQVSDSIKTGRPRSGYTFEKVEA